MKGAAWTKRLEYFLSFGLPLIEKALTVSTIDEDFR